MKKKLLVLLMSVLLVVQVGCGGVSIGGNGNSGVVGHDPWKLFTEEEAEKVLGFDVEQDLQKMDESGQKLVYYGATSEDEKDFIQVSVARDEDMSDNLKQSGFNVGKLFEQVKQDFPDKQDVEGFGKEAFWANGALHILEEGVYVSISTGTPDDAKNLDRAKEIANTVMSRLEI